MTEIITFPNQRVITVEKPDYKANKDEPFLQVGKTEWLAAAQYLTYSAFKLYLYLATNKNGFTFALSYAAINQELPMNRKTLYKCVNELKDCGYLRQIKDNYYVFSTKC